MTNEETFLDNLVIQFAQKRYELGLTQQDVDLRIGVTNGLVAKWECGNRKPTLFNAHCWAEALGCQIKLEANDGDMRH